MDAKCTRSNCYAPEVTCALGCLEHLNCPSWSSKESNVDKNNTTPSNLVLPWSGSALGLVDMAFVSSRSKPIVVGIAGPQNAGKTTLLASWYLQVCLGKTPNNFLFSGSYTIDGWEAVSHSLRWRPGYLPSFPPHTSSRGSRVPGLLHFQFTCNDTARNFLFADAPGEWFQKWATNKESVEAEGAIWLAEHADVFILVADCEALSSENKGAARGALQRLAQRLFSEIGDRPVALVWTKSEIQVAPEMVAAVRQSIKESLSRIDEFRISVLSQEPVHQQGILELLNWVLNAKRRTVSLNLHERFSSDPLFIVGSR